MISHSSRFLSLHRRSFDKYILAFISKNVLRSIVSSVCGKNGLSFVF